MIPKREYTSEVDAYNPLDFSVDQVKPTPPAKSTISTLGKEPKVIRVSSPKRTPTKEPTPPINQGMDYRI
jgi:hypothetical protein